MLTVIEKLQYIETVLNKIEYNSEGQVKRAPSETEFDNASWFLEQVIAELK